jgi:hypothetical protein
VRSILATQANGAVVLGQQGRPCPISSSSEAQKPQQFMPVMPQQKHHINFLGASCSWFLAVSVCCFRVSCSKVSWNCLLKHTNFLPAHLQYNLQVAYNDGMIGAKKPQVYEQWASPHDDCDYDNEKSLFSSNLAESRIFEASFSPYSFMPP